MVYFKAHVTFEDKIFAFCDPELIGNEYRDDKRKITLNIKEKFYKGELVPIGEALSILRISKGSCNIVGSLAYLAVKEGLAPKQALLWIIDSNMHVRIPHLILVPFSR